MDYKNYLEKKAKGNAEIITAGGGFAIVVKKFDVETGDPIAPEITSIDLDSLEAQKLELQSKIADIEAIKTEINTLQTN